MSGQLTSVDLTLVSTSASLFPAVGTKHVTPLGYVYQVVKAAGTMAQGEFCFITSDGNFSATSLTNTNAATGIIGMVGNVGQSGISSGYYFWAQRSGAIALGKVAASCVQDVKLFATGTAGVVDDATASSAGISGLKLLATVVGASTVPCFATTEMWTF